MEIPGSVVGIYSKSPSFNGGMNSLPRCIMGYDVAIKIPRAASRVVFRHLSTHLINGI